MSSASHEPFGSQFCELVIGVRAPGTKAERYVHVDDLCRETEFGDRCQCLCPACMTPVRAFIRGGDKQRSHYKHRPSGGHIKPPCSGAPETALHKMAKQEIVDALSMHLPDAAVRLEGVEEIAWRGNWVQFASAIAEKEIHPVRPDVVAEWDGGQLWIEVWVTNEVKDGKRQVIQERNQATIEIDLRDLPRDASRDVIRSAVLDGSRTRWIHHPLFPDTRRRLSEQLAAARRREEARKTAEQARLKAEADHVATALQRPWPDNELPTAEERRVRQAGLEALIGAALEGTMCFRVRPEVWQSRIVSMVLLDRTEKPTHSDNVWRAVRGCVRPEADVFGQEKKAFLEAAVEGYRDPWATVRTYLKWLRDGGWIRLDGKWIESSALARDTIAIRRERVRLLRRAYEEISRGARTPLPFSFREWTATPLVNGMTPQQAVFGRKENWAWVAERLDALIGILEPKDTSSDFAAAVEADGLPEVDPSDLLGLPLEFEQAKWVRLVVLAKDARDRSLLDDWRRDVQEAIGAEAGARWAEGRLTFRGRYSTRSERSAIAYEVQQLKRDAKRAADLKSAMWVAAVAKLPSHDAAEAWFSRTVAPAAVPGAMERDLQERLERDLRAHVSALRIAADREKLTAEAVEKLGHEAGHAWAARELQPLLDKGELDGPARMRLVHSMEAAAIRMKRIDWLRYFYADVSAKSGETGEPFEVWLDTPVHFGISPRRRAEGHGSWEDFVRALSDAADLLKPLPSPSGDRDWVNAPRLPDASVALGLPLRQRLASLHDEAMAAKLRFDRDLVASFVEQAAAAVGSDQSEAWIADLIQPAGRLLTLEDRNRLKSGLGALRRKAEAAAWARGMAATMREAAVARFGHEAGQLIFDAEAAPLLKAAPLDEAALVAVQERFGLPMSLPPDSHHMTRIGLSAESIRSRLVALLGPEDAADHYEERIAPFLNERTTPADIEAAEAKAEAEVSRFNPGTAKTRMANSLRDAMLPSIEALLGKGHAAEDWRAEHLDPAYEAVRVGQMSRRRARRRLEELLAQHRETAGQ